MRVKAEPTFRFREKMINIVKQCTSNYYGSTNSSIHSENSPVDEAFAVSRTGASSSSASLSAGAPASSQLSINATLPPTMPSLTAGSASSSGRNPVASSTNTDKSLQHQSRASLTVSSDVNTESRESTYLDVKSSLFIDPTAKSPFATPLKYHKQDFTSFSTKPPVASSRSQNKSEKKGVLSAVRSQSLVPSATPSLPTSSQSPFTSATSPTMTSSAAASASSSGRNPVTSSTNTDKSLQHQSRASLTVSSDVKTESRESTYLDVKSSSFIDPTAKSPFATPLKYHKQDFTSFSAMPPVASSKRQHKSERKSVLSAVRTHSPSFTSFCYIIVASHPYQVASKCDALEV